MLTSWSEQSTRRSFQRMVLTLPPARANSIRPDWVNPRFPPSRHPHPQLGTSTAPGRSPCPHLTVGLGTGLDIRTTPPFTGRSRRQQDRPDSTQVGSACGLRVQPSGRASAGHGMALVVRDQTPPPSDQRAVVVVPRRTRQREQPGRSANDAPAFGFGSTNTCDGRRPPQPMCSDNSIPLPNTSRTCPDTTT